MVAASRLLAPGISVLLLLQPLVLHAERVRSEQRSRESASSRRPADRSAPAAPAAAPAPGADSAGGAAQTAPAPAGSRNDAQINEAWMQAIRNEGQAPANGAAPDSAASSDEGRFANPGAGSEGAGESAESGAAPTSPAPATQSSTLFPHEEGPSFLSVALRFFGLLAVMGFVFYLVMRYIRNKSGLPAVGGGELVHVVASIPLVQGKFLQIVDVAGKLMALGVSEAGVQMLTEINDGIAADRIRLWQSSKRPEQAASSALERLVGALKGSDFRFWQTADRKRDFPDFQQLLRAQGAAPLAAVSSAPDAPSGADAADQSDDLKELLRQQKARLTALQRPRKN